MATNLKYYAQKRSDGYPHPSTMMGFEDAPTGENLVEIKAEDSAAAEGQKVVASSSGLRYFVRRSKDGNIIPNSLIATRNKPKGLVYEFKVITTA
jgi:hypothetical protein